MYACAFVHEVVTCDRFALLIGKQRKRIACLLREVTQLIRRINTDCDRSNAGLIKSSEILLDAPQLGVADWSPIAAIENYEHAFRRLVVDRLRKQFRKSDRLVACVDQVEL